MYRFPYNLTPRAIRSELRWAHTRITSAYKRARYGYSPADMNIYGYDGSMMTWTGKSMMELTRYKTGHPMSYPDLESWNTDLCFYGLCLVVGGDSQWTQEDYDWAKAAFPELWGSAALKAAAGGTVKDHIVMYRIADEIGRIGLVWLSEHYMSLWD